MKPRCGSLRFQRRLLVHSSLRTHQEISFHRNSLGAADFVRFIRNHLKNQRALCVPIQQAYVPHARRSFREYLEHSPMLEEGQNIYGTYRSVMSASFWVALLHQS